LNCVDNISSEFPFSNSIQGALVTEWDYGNIEFLFDENGTFDISYREFCFAHLEDRYCGLTESDTFLLNLQGIWGPHDQTITERENLSNCGGFGNPFSSCDVNFTYNELYGSAPFTVMESNLEHYNGLSGSIEYLIMCGPIQGLPPHPPYRYMRQVVLRFEDDPHELELFWQLIYEE